jgi:Flp pilus assembly protein TadG
MRKQRTGKNKGIAVLLTAVTMTFVIPLAGIAVDAGAVYVVKGRLSAACDAAALATARNLNVGMTLEEQAARARERGIAFFQANFPPVFLGATRPDPVIEVAQTTLNTLTVTATANVTVPTYFLRILRQDQVNVSASGKASRRDVNMYLVLDRSGSMGPSCDAMKAAARDFVSRFVPGRDDLGLITFNGGAYHAFPHSTNFRSGSTTLDSQIAAISCSGSTNAAYSYRLAYNYLAAINEPSSLNIIVFFTDGEPNGITADYPIKTISDTRYGWGSGSCGSTSTQCTMPKSTCNDDSGRVSTDPNWGKPYGADGRPYISAKRGSLNGNSNTATGPTYGLVQYQTSSQSNDTAIPSSQRTGCQMSNSQSRIRQDVAYIPDNDILGTSTRGYMPLTVFPSGHPYAGRIRPDVPRNILYAGFNLVDNAARAIRSDTRLNVITYTIGLDGNGGINPDSLMRMANDPRSPTFDPTKPEGLYAYAGNASELASAFNRIASEILRLAR